jgi:ADP-heptose:LPS heptosyltransferase
MLVHVTGDRIGDALIKWPVIAALKKALPQYRLVWLAGLRKSVFAGPLAPLATGVIDEVRDVAGTGVSWRELFAAPPPGKFDIVVATEPKLRSAVLLRRLRHDVFISPALNFLLSDRKPERASAYPKSVFEQMRCLATLAAGRELDIDTTIDVGADSVRIARELLPAGATYIGLAPGSAGESKRWPLERYVQLAERQLQARRTPVFFLGPEEAPLRERIAQSVPAALFPEQAPAARGGPLLSIALAQRIAVGVANDAGGGHLLAAGGRPLVTLFGHTSEDKFKPPYGTRVAIKAREYGGTDMSLIPLERVATAVDAAVREAP